MKANDLIAKARLIRDSDGKRKAVQPDWADWEDLLEFLEDVAEIERFRASGEKTVPGNRSRRSCARRELMYSVDLSARARRGLRGVWRVASAQAMLYYVS